MALGVSRDGIEIQRDLMGDLEGKRVLDLGCAAGNELSLHMAERAHSYVAIDLSGRGIQKLENRLREAGFDEANTLVVDFLSDEFRERDFDLVYAHGVLHHFRHIDVLLARLQEVLVPGGRVVAYDPLNTSLVARLVRSLYRPFQTDAAWEWPFTRATFERFSRDFELEVVQGLLGYSKWAVPIFVLPIPARWKALFGKASAWPGLEASQHHRAAPLALSARGDRVAGTRSGYGGLRDDSKTSPEYPAQVPEGL